MFRAHTIHYGDGSSSFVHTIHTHLQNYAASRKIWGSHSNDVETGRSSRSYYLLKVMTLLSAEVSRYLLHGEGHNHTWHHITQHHNYTKKLLMLWLIMMTKHVHKCYLRTETCYITSCVITTKCCKINARYCTQEPSSLPFILDRTARLQYRGPLIDSRQIYTNTV